MTYGHTLAQEPLSQGTLNLQFWKTISWSTINLVCLSNALAQSRKFFKDIMHFHCMVYNVLPQHKNLFPEGYEIYNSVNPSLLLLLHVYTVRLIYAQKNSEYQKNTTKYINFILFRPNIISSCGHCHEIDNVLSLYPTDVALQILLEKKMLTDNTQKRTPTHSN